jgi:alpha-glucosidase (family GH31 glycosyl hydrolase)
MNLESLTLVETSTSKIRIDAGASLNIVIEPHAPGTFRVRVGAESELVREPVLTGRNRLHAETLLIRSESIGEAQIQSLLGQVGWLLTQGEIYLQVDRYPFCIKLMRQDEVLLSTTLDGLASENGRWCFGFDLTEGQSIHGLGETAGDFDRRGEYVVSDDPSHRALPVAWSPQGGWGVYVNTLGRVDHDLGHTNDRVYEIHAESKVLDFFIFAGDPAEILNQYSQLTGRAGQPPLWAMGPWLKQPEGKSTTETIEFVQTLRQIGVSIDVVEINAPMCWAFQESKLTIGWHKARFPDAKQVLDYFARHAIQVCLPTAPVIEVGTETFEDLEDRGWLLARENGDPCVFPGQGITNGVDFALLDLTHRDVYKLWVERHRQLIDDGVGAFSCDAQFELPDDVSPRGEESAALLRVLYPALVRQALNDASSGHKVPPEAVVLSHDLHPGVQRFAWQAAPVVPDSWQGMALSLRLALSSGDSGVASTVHSLKLGAQNASEADIARHLRWLAMSVFSTNFSIDAVEAELAAPCWNDKTREIAAQWLQWRYRLIPYVLGLIEDAARTGVPVQRSMALSFPQDARAHAESMQYMLGPALLVAPILSPGNKITVYLPANEAWWDLSTGWRYEGGTELEVEVGLDSMPVFGREGHMLCLGLPINHTGEFNTARLLDEVWMFGMPVHNPTVMRNKIRVMQMQGSSYIKGLEGLKILPSEGLEVKRRGAEVRISRAR